MLTQGKNSKEGESVSNMFHFPNISYVEGNIRVDINLDRFSKQFEEAQEWLGDRVLEDCKSVMPHLTGNLQQRSTVEEKGKEVVFPGPAARFLYGGKVMVGEHTRSPWAREGEKKVITDRKLDYSNPQAVDHWFDEAKARYGEVWIEGVKERAGGK